MRIFQPTYKDRKGKRQKTERWHVAFQDHAGVWRRVVGKSDRSASETIGRHLQTLADKRAAGDSIPPVLAEWLDGIDNALRAKLIEWALLDERANHAAKPLTGHIDDWHDDLLNRGRTVDHAALVKARVTHLFTGCGFARYADLDAAKVNKHLAGMRPGKSIQTTNHYATHAKEFCNWMVKNGRATGNPLAHLEKGNAQTDRSYVRRPLTVDEATRLVKAAKASKSSVNNAGGVERSVVYHLALETGLRRNEIRTLTRDAFDLDSDKPTMTLKAANAKNRKPDVFALRSDLAALLRLHLAKKLPSARAFSIGHHTAMMLRADLTDAGIVDRDDEGRYVDFHSLRCTFITNLGRVGVPLVQAQKLARHSDPRLTANVYSQFDNTERRAAIDMLPRIAAAG
jgi:integrase